MLRAVGPKLLRVQAEDRPHRVQAAAILEVHPWVQDVFAPAQPGGHCIGDSRNRRIGARGAEGRPDGPAEEAHHLPELDENDVFDELMHRRALWAAEYGEGVEHFATTVRGGEWTASHVGEAVDSLRCYASTAQAKQFCAAHLLAKTSTFSLRL